jgi:hypothetical protein
VVNSAQHFALRKLDTIPTRSLGRDECHR